MRFPSTSALFSAVVSLRMAALVVSAVAAIPDAAARFSAAREVWRALEGPASVCTAIFFRFAGGSGPLWSSPSAAVSPPSSPNPKICMLARFPLRFSLRSACRFAIPSSCFLIRCAAPHSKTWISSFWFSEYPGLSSSLSGWGARESIAIGCPYKLRHGPTPPEISRIPLGWGWMFYRRDGLEDFGQTWNRDGVGPR
ncbi:hypothetical protein AcV5_010495 [Taiwanofungus camphoratus]|nr:hypothetical protein AcV5_010495 [Antrodia cinnamomea]